MEMTTLTTAPQNIPMFERTHMFLPDLDEEDSESMLHCNYSFLSNFQQVRKKSVWKLKYLTANFVEGNLLKLYLLVNDQQFWSLFENMNWLWVVAGYQNEDEVSLNSFVNKFNIFQSSFLFCIRQNCF